MLTPDTTSPAKEPAQASATPAQEPSSPKPVATTIRFDSKRFTLEKLTDDGTKNNYGEWIGVAKSKLMLLRLWKYISGPESTPPVIPAVVEGKRVQALDESTKQMRWFIIEGNEIEVAKAKEEAEPWLEGNLAARTLLLEALPSEKRSLFTDDDTAKNIWDYLAEDYRPLNFTRTQTQFQDIMKFSCDERMDVTKWADQLRRMYIEMRSHDPSRISDSNFAVTIGSLLPATAAWSEFGSRLFDKLSEAEANGTPLSSNKVFSLIKQHDWTIKKDDPASYAEAYNTSALYPKRSRSPSVNQTSTKRAKTDDVPKCENKHCTRPRGHRTKDCIAYGGAKCGQYPEGWRGRTDIHLPPDQRAPKSKNRQQVFNKASANATDAEPEKSSDAQVSAALAEEGEFYSFNCLSEPDPSTTITCNTIAFTAGEKHSSSEVIHDTDANRHIFFERDVFANYRPIKALQVKGFGSSLVTSAVGVGDVYLRATNNGEVTSIKLSDVLHVPSARLNLVSQGCLERRGVDCTIRKGTLMLSANGKTIISGNLQSNNMYRLDVTPIPRSLIARLHDAHKALRERISVPLIDRMSNEPIGATSSTVKPYKVAEDFCTA